MARLRANRSRLHAAGAARTIQVDVTFIALTVLLAAATIGLVFAFERLRHGRNDK